MVYITVHTSKHEFSMVFYLKSILFQITSVFSSHIAVDIKQHKKLKIDESKKVNNVQA